MHKSVMETIMAVAVLTCSACAADGWTPLFNGRDLDGWIPKIKGYPAGENFANTFRVEDGLLKVRYDGYEGAFNNRFGHIFHVNSFSNYLLRVEYRFVGEQLPDGPGWANRNSGVMLHGQTPQSMSVGQAFPVSIELQLLGGLGKGPRTTANLCTPGTNVEVDGQLFTPHVLNSKSETYDGDQWVEVEVEVRGSRTIIHRIGGEIVLRYDRPQYDPKDGDAKALIEAAGGSLLIEGGSISLQSESSPCDFRKVEIKLLKD